jgi:hypothetical protein
LESTGSGDRTFDYIRLLLNIIISALGTFAWFGIDSKIKTHKRLQYLFSIIIRITLFLSMQLYGFGKVLKGQFPDHSYEKLIQTVGEMSPMGLAWTFMGHSHMYNLFIGFAEILGGVLMLYRKTVTLGSLIILGVMTNVFMMNMTYDIPVKIVSGQLILMTLILLSFDRVRLVNFFFKNHDVSKREFNSSTSESKSTAVAGLKKLLMFGIFSIVGFQVFLQYNMLDQLKDKSTFYGLWETELFVMNKDTLPPLLKESERWRFFIVERKNSASIKSMDGEMDRFKFDLDENNQTISLKNLIDSSTYSYAYKHETADEIQLNSINQSDSLNILLKRIPDSEFKLINRGFHWINEGAYNR